MSNSATQPTAPSTHTISESAPASWEPDTPPRPARPAGYWERVDRIVSSAPALSAGQRAVIRSAFHRPEARRAAA